MKQAINSDQKSKKLSLTFKVLTFSLLVLVLIGGVLFFMRNTLRELWLTRDELVLVDGVYLSAEDAKKAIDDADEHMWKQHKDVEKVEKAIGKQIASASKAAAKKDGKKFMKYCSEEFLSLYGETFLQNEDNLPLLCQVLDDLEMTYLAPATEGDEVTMNRVAEYQTILNQQTVTVVFIYENGRWLIQSL